MAHETEITTIPKLRMVFRLTKAQLDALAGLRDGALGFATDDTILYRQNGDGAANWEAITTLSLPAGMSLKPNVVRWVLPGWLATNDGTRALQAGRIYYIPIFVPETTTYIRIGIEVTTLQVGSADLRIFNCENGLPTSLVLSCGSVDVGTTGLKELTINQELTRGHYFLALRADIHATLRTISPTDPFYAPVDGLATSQDIDTADIVMYVVAAFADPAPAPTGITSILDAFVLLREN